MPTSTIVGQPSHSLPGGGVAPLLDDAEAGAALERSQKPEDGRRAAGALQPGLVVDRRFTEAGTDPLGGLVWERRTSTIQNPDGSVVFKMEGAEVPAEWSQLATDIVVSKYFRKAGLFGDKQKGETSV